MPRLLSRLAGACARRAWWTLIAWGLALLAVGTAAAAEGRELSNVFNISTRAADLAARVQAELPEAAGATGQIVYTTADGAGFTDLQKQQIASELDDVRQVPGVVEVIDPFETEAYRDELMAAFLSGQLPADQLAYYQQVGQAAMGYRVVSTDGTTAVATVVFEYGPYEVPADVKKLVQRAAGWSVGGVRTDFSQELVLDIEALMGPAEIVGVLMAGVVLLIMLGSLVAAGLPLLAAGLGVGTAVLGALAFAGTVHMTSTTLILGIMLGLAVGIDYSLFIINRHRRRLRELADLGALGAPGQGRAAVRESIADAAASGGRAVVFAGGTVVTALAALNLTGIDFLGDMGTVGAVAVAVGVAVALTFTPAVLSLVGWHLLPRRRRRAALAAAAAQADGVPAAGEGSTALAIQQAVAAAAVQEAIAATSAAAESAPTMAALAATAPAEESAAADGPSAAPTNDTTDTSPTAAPSPAKPGWTRRLADGIGAFPALHPVVTLVAGVVLLGAIAVPFHSLRLGLTDGSSAPVGTTQYRAFKQVEAAFGAGANSPLLAVADLPAGLSEAEVTQLEATITQQLFDLRNVKAVVPVGTSPDLTMGVFQVISKGSPSSTATENLVYAIRDMSASLEAATGATIDVTGAAAINIDMADTLAGALPLYMAVVVGLSLVLMFLAFRSVAVPLLGAAGFLLSFLAALGATVAVYQWGWLGGLLGVHDPGPILSFLPTVLVGIQFGLAMDYQLFLVSGMREQHLAGQPARQAVTRGLQANRSVVMAAALIMMAVFGSFTFSDITQVRSLAFGMTLGIGLDAFVVRLGLIPAALTLLGEKAWWAPGRRRKVNPAP